MCSSASLTNYLTTSHRDTFTGISIGVVSRNLKEFEEMLPEPDFFRVHQSHIVNTSFVDKVIKEDGDHVVMTDGEKIPVSRRRKEEFMSIVLHNR